MALKNIILDLGGVLLNIDYSITEKAFKDLGYENFEAMYSQFTADELFSKLEKGQVSPEAFLQQMETAGKGKISKEQITHAWNKMLLTWREESLAFLQQLSLKYKLYLLSNTNAIHLKAFNEILEKQTGRSEGIDDLFTKAYYSHQVNYRKPNEDIFVFLAKDARIMPEETLFIDDSSNNIETAKRLGFKTHLLVPGEKVEELDYSSF